MRENRLYEKCMLFITVFSLFVSGFSKYIQKGIILSVVFAVISCVLATLLLKSRYKYGAIIGILISVFLLIFCVYDVINDVENKFKEEKFSKANSLILKKKYSGALFVLQDVGDILNNDIQSLLKIEEIQEKQDNQFKVDYNSAEFDFENQNYIEAAKKYNMMLGYISDRDNLIMIKRKMAFSYCLQGINGLTNEKNFYFDKAISTLKEILSMKIKLSEEEMFSLQYDLALVYVYYNNENYYEDLKEFVNKIENKLEEKSDLPCSISEAYYLLGMFYKNKFYKDFKSEDLKKTKECFGNALNFKIKAEEQDMLQRVFTLSYKEHAAYFYFRYAIFTKNPENSDKIYNCMSDDLLTSVTIYNEVLSDITFEEFPSIYFRCVKDLARCYMFLNELQKAYENFKKFIYLDDKSLDIWLYGSYMFAMLDLNQEDINILLKRYHRLVDYYNEMSDIEEMCETKFELVICYYNLLNKQNSRDYYDKGKMILNELKNKYYGYYNTKRDGDIDMYMELYEEVEKNSLID